MIRNNKVTVMRGNGTGYPTSPPRFKQFVPSQIRTQFSEAAREHVKITRHRLITKNEVKQRVKSKYHIPQSAARRDLLDHASAS